MAERVETVGTARIVLAVFVHLSLSFGRYGASDPTVVVCANFCDSKSRVVTEKEGRQWYATPLRCHGLRLTRVQGSGAGFPLL